MRAAEHRVTIAGLGLATSERFWLNLQTRYDLDMVRDRLGPRLEREVAIASR